MAEVGFGCSVDMWRGDRTENPAGGMAATGIHVLDAMIALQAPIRHVAVLSRCLAVENPVDDTTTVPLDFASGATGRLSTITATAAGWRLRVSGSAVWAEMPDRHPLVMAPASRCSSRVAGHGSRTDPYPGLTDVQPVFRRDLRPPSHHSDQGSTLPLSRVSRRSATCDSAPAP